LLRRNATRVSKAGLGQHNVGYFRCQVCGSLQTETPYWMEQAYSGDAERYDTGKASRTLANFLLLPHLLQILQVNASDVAVDFGGGTGLLARLMRDAGFNFSPMTNSAAANLWAGIPGAVWTVPVA